MNPFDLPIPAQGINLEKVMGEIERELLIKALDRSGGVKKKAAELLNVSFRSFRYRLEKYGIAAEGEDDEDEY